MRGAVLTPRSEPGPPLDLERLRAALRGLALGIAYLHSQGRLHRDLKPSNVLVTPEGRVVVLDFGLVAELDGDQSLSEEAGAAIVGTAAYMAPEQAASGPISGASDWYGFGVMLFQALTGRLPFDGPPVQVMLEKQRRPAPAPRELRPEVPPDLDALCVRLLRTEPGERPAAEEILRVLGAAAPTAVAPRRATGLVGRLGELSVLRAALARSRGGEPQVVRLLGVSGIGKTALLRAFSQEAEASGALVLGGRCYEREAVPFKALDSVVDALARHLAALPPERADALSPRDASVLVRMFPVLGRVPAFRDAPAREVREPQEQRRRAVLAMRELLGRMGDRGPLVFIVDDAQWGDADSAAVLEEVLRPPEAPSMLAIISARSDGTPLVGLALGVTDLELSPLPADAARELVLGLRVDPARLDGLVAEAAGNPFLLHQLAEAQAGARLDDVVRERLDALSPAARRLLSAVAVAGSPVGEQVAARAAGLAPDDVDTVGQLKAERLVRGVGDGDLLETWHDRIREAVTASLDPGHARSVHARLADALAAQPSADLDAVAWHLAAAGLTERAAEAMLGAARRAEALLAFERAAVLFQRVLELLPGADLRRRELTIALGDCLAHAGRGPDAAAAYHAARAAAGPGPMPEELALEVDRRAAEQLLRAGHVDEGLEAIHRVLERVDMTLARTPARALAALLFRRAQVALRGLHFEERPAAQVSARVLQRIDVCWSVSVGLSMVDTIRGASFQTRQLLLALEAGEPMRVGRALCAEAAYVATAGLAADRKAQRLIEQSRGVALRLGDGPLLGWVAFCECLTHFLVGRWREAQRLSAEAERLFRELGSQVTWEAANMRLFSVWSLFYLGDLQALARGIPELVAQARARGDRYTVASLQSGLANVALLARGDPQGARAAVREATASWSARSFHFQHYWAALSEAMIDLYLGAPEEAWRRLGALWPQLDRAKLLVIQNVRVEAKFLRARAALATGRREEALAMASELEREQVGWAQGFSLALRGLVAGGQGAELLREALQVFEAADMQLFAAVARLRLGEVQGGELGAANTHAALAWMRVQGVKEPDRLAQMLLPAAR